MAVMMQAFYWDALIKENKRGDWWNFIAEKVPQLSLHFLVGLLQLKTLRDPIRRME
jgi:hypothetical protein